MKAKISLITLGVSDLERSRAFYEDGLGFPRHGNSEGVVFFELEGTWLALFPREELAKDATVPLQNNVSQGFSLAHNVSSKEEVRETLELAEKSGGKIIKLGQDVFWGGYSGYFADPDGFLWEVAWNPFMDLT
jgi:uncharacterized protein